MRACVVVVPSSDEPTVARSADQSIENVSHSSQRGVSLSQTIHAATNSKSFPNGG